MTISDINKLRSKDTWEKLKTCSIVNVSKIKLSTIVNSLTQTTFDLLRISISINVLDLKG